MVSSQVLKIAGVSLASSILAHPVEHHDLVPRLQQHRLDSTDSYVLRNDSGVWPYREYMTTNVTTPQFVVQRNGQPVANGSLFLTLSNLLGTGEHDQGAFVMSSDGDLIWAGPQGATSNLRKQTYKGNPVITTWTGDGSAAAAGGASHGYGEVQMYDTQYEVIQTVCPTASQLNIKFAPGTISTCVADVHESYITENNTMLVTVYNLTQTDLSSLGGPKNGYITNSLLVEVDIESGTPIFVWNPLEHVPINATHLSLSGAGTNASNSFDWFHMNSIQSFNGGYLVNSRQTWSSYFINKQGNIEWKLNGETGGSFGILPQGYNFSWEHDARLHTRPDGKILYTVFNDYNGDLSTHNPSTGISLILDPASKSVQPYAKVMDSKQSLDAVAEGSYQLIDNDTALLGYGVYPVIKEFDLKPGNGSSVKYTAQFAYNNLSASSYRSFKFDWSATPCVPVDVLIATETKNASAGNTTGSGKTGYASWNGATDVTRYAIYSATNGNASAEDTGYYFDKKGFETSFQVPTELTTIQIVALAGSKELGRSSTVTV